MSYAELRRALVGDRADLDRCDRDAAGDRNPFRLALLAASGRKKQGVRELVDLILF